LSPPPCLSSSSSIPAVLVFFSLYFCHLGLSFLWSLILQISKGRSSASPRTTYKRKLHYEKGALLSKIHSVFPPPSFTPCFLFSWCAGTVYSPHGRLLRPLYRNVCSNAHPYVLSSPSWLLHTDLPLQWERTAPGSRSHSST
jgi:hypothetical protein